MWHVPRGTLFIKILIVHKFENVKHRAKMNPNVILIQGPWDKSYWQENHRPCCRESNFPFTPNVFNQCLLLGNILYSFFFSIMLSLCLCLSSLSLSFSLSSLYLSIFVRKKMKVQVFSYVFYLCYTSMDVYTTFQM